MADLGSRPHRSDAATEGVVLTREQADSIARTLIEMAVRLPMKYRDHAEALALLEWRPE